MSLGNQLQEIGTELNAGIVEEEAALEAVVEAFDEAGVEGDPETVATLLPTAAVRRMYREVPDQADELLSATEAARRQIGADGVQTVLGTAIQQCATSGDGVAPENVSAALRMYSEATAGATTGDPGGRPSKVQRLLDRLTDGELADASTERRGEAVQSFRADVTGPTWRKFHDQATDAGVDVEELLEAAPEQTD